MTTRTYLPTDWSVWIYKPVAGKFILDISQLNDATAPLSSTNGVLEVADLQIASMIISQGSEVSNGFLTELNPGTLELTVLIENFQKEMSNQFLIGTRIGITCKNYNSSADSIYFKGFISSFSVSLNPQSNIATVSISALSILANTVNLQMNISKVAGADVFTSIQDAIPAATGGQLSIDSYTPITGATWPATKNEVKTIGEWLSDLGATQLFRPQINFGGSVNNNYHSIYYYSPNDDEWAPVFDFDESNITEMNLDWSGAGSPTGISFTNFYDSNITYSYGLGVLDSSGGAFNYSATLDVNGSSQMASIGQKILSLNKTYQPVTITTITARTYGQIDFGVATSYPIPAIAEKVRMNISANNVNNAESFITGRTIEVTPDNWTTTYNLWKGFTA
jgi:hypothetical protein